MLVGVLGEVDAHAFGSRVDCFPVSKQLALQVVRAPMQEGSVLVVVEDDLCGVGGHAPSIDPAPVVPPASRGELPAEMQGAENGVLGPEALVPTVREVVASVDRSLGRRPSEVTVEGDVLLVIAGDAAFLQQRVTLQEDDCAYAQEGYGWSVYAAQYCALDQIGGGTFAPRQASPGWAAGIPNRISLRDVELQDALLSIYRENGVELQSMFFLVSPGEADGSPSRRVAMEVHYPVMPPDAKPLGIQEYEPSRATSEFREIPGDTDVPHRPVEPSP